MILGVRRRFVIAAVSLVISWVLFHGYVAALLWTRGDGLLRGGSPDAAEGYYRRALAIDPDSRDALDRLLFASIERKRQPDLDDAILAGDRYLARHPDALEIRTDRALALFVAHRNGSAAEEFSWLASRFRDERFTKLAGLARMRDAEGKRS